MKRLSLGLLITATLIAANVPLRETFDEQKFERFMNSASRFERELYACPDDAYRIDQCSPKQGIVDSKLKAEVWKQGRELFGR